MRIFFKSIGWARPPPLSFPSRRTCTLTAWPGIWVVSQLQPTKVTSLLWSRLHQALEAWGCV